MRRQRGRDFTRRVGERVETACGNHTKRVPENEQCTVSKDKVRSEQRSICTQQERPLSCGVDIAKLSLLKSFRHDRILLHVHGVN
jgi:hypothetical protein